MSSLTHPDPPAQLRNLTPARVALGRTGVSQQTRDQLLFQRDHAQARDAVHAALDLALFAATLADVTPAPILRLHSAAPDRATYLQRPDLGRALDPPSLALLTACAQTTPGPFHLVIVIADGLSALAVERHAAPLLAEWLPQLASLLLAPLCLVEQARVAIGDQIGSALQAQLAVILIGERPGLSSPDSLGAYITWNPQPGRTDAERNCISNIRPGGLTYSQAAGDLTRLTLEARRLQLSGVHLKLEANLLGKD